MLSKRLRNFNNIFINKSIDLSVAINSILSDYKPSHSAKFIESIDVVFNLGLDPKNSSNVIKSFVDFDFSFRKGKKLLLFADGKDKAVASSLGVDIIVDKSEIDLFLKGGFKGYEICVSTEDMLFSIKPLARVLGPKGLMPNQKLGTVFSSENLEKTISLFVKGERVSFGMDKNSAVKLSFGSLSLSSEENIRNFVIFFNLLKSLKPTSFKGIDYIRSCFISTTMGSSYKISLSSLYSL